MILIDNSSKTLNPCEARQLKVQLCKQSDL